MAASIDPFHLHIACGTVTQGIKEDGQHSANCGKITAFALWKAGMPLKLRIMFGADIVGELIKEESGWVNIHPNTPSEIQTWKNEQ